MIRIFSILFLSLFVGCSIFSQTQDLPQSEIEVRKQFRAHLEEVKSVRIILPREEIDTSRTFIRNYELSVVPISLEYPPPQLKPLAMPAEEQATIFPLSLELGYGLQNNPFAEIAYSKKFDRLFVNLGGSFESVKDLSNDKQTFRDIHGDLNIGYALTDLLNLSTDISYTQLQRGIYGSELDITQDPEQFNYRIPEVTLSLRNVIPTAMDIDYEFAYHYSNTSDNTELSEVTNNIDASAVKHFGEGELSFGLIGSLSFNTLKNEGSKNNNVTVLGAQASFHQDRWLIKARAKAGFFDEQTTFLPDLELVATIQPLIQPFAGVKSKLIQNTFHHLTLKNPYLARSFNEITNTTEIKYYGGIRGEVDRGKFEFKAEYKNETDGVLLANTFPNSALFEPVFDDIITFSLGIHADAEIIDYISGEIEFIYNSIQTDQEEKAWHRPSYTWKASAIYTKLFYGQLTLKGSVESIGGLNYKDVFGEAQRLKAQYHFHIHGDYSISEKLTGFLHINNIFNNRTAYFFTYERVAINPQIGLRLRM